MHVILRLPPAEPHALAKQFPSSTAQFFILSSVIKVALSSTNANRMHAVAFTSLRRTAQRQQSRRSCRIVAGSRCSHPRRNFHCSLVAYRTPDAFPAAPDSEKAPPENPENGTVESKVEEAVMGATEGPTEVDNIAINARTRNGKATISGRIRGNRSRQTEGLPPFNFPDWFLENNVKCLGDSDLSGSLAVYGEKGVKEGSEADIADTKMAAEIERQSVDLSECELSPAESAKYLIHLEVYKEILTTLRAGLALRPPQNSNQLIPRPITLLQCPKDGGSYFLDSVVEALAVKLGADLVRLDAQDIAQLVGPYCGENLAWHRCRTSLLGYEAHKVAGKLEAYDKEFTEQDEVEDAEEEEEALTGMPKTGKALGDFKKRLASIFTGSRPDSSRSNLPRIYGPYTITNPIISLQSAIFDQNNDGQQGKPATSAGPPDVWDNLKVTTLFETLTVATDFKRCRNSNRTDNTVGSGSLDESRNIILQLRDYKELSGTLEGAELIGRLRQAVNKRWQMGRNIILVGTTSTEEAEPALSKPEIQHLQSDIVDGEKRTIYVPPARGEDQNVAFETDEKARMRRTNIRHVSDMIMKLAEGTQHLSRAVIDLEKDLDTATVYSAGLEDAVWTYAKVHRVATTILGLESSLSSIDGPIFSRALKILAASDEAKFSWAAEELKEEDAEVEEVLIDIDSAQNRAKDKLREIGKKCTRHEKKLLSGVVLPNDIRTTFADIRAPKETIEALKTLTSLSLIRPEAFSYGVLATDKIPGLLLYGPPGTGKTLLAKAVAKESGATVLEVSAADLNDMFVGESEKNVKAVFSLAKKLSPCVVFIDEADAIFSARGETKRTAHRELINQFLREWDGMNDMSAFVFCATNRPFDLDEAVLRRLPRRLLIDLPVENDREAILKIHLKEELLDESVNVSKLAKETPFYSGSDLKNLAVAAALACIREENEVAAKHECDEPYVYPEKRILTKAHFDKAMEEISASISEDMSTLTAIRKFDEKYGDRKGRRKKASALGFGGTTIEEKDSEAARVRKMEA